MAIQRIGRIRHAVVVDADTKTRRDLRDLLEGDGFRVTATGEGEALLSMLPGHHPDIVLIEMTLPGMQGLDVLRRLQDGPRIPTIIVTDKCDETDRVVGLEMGADDYVAKPYAPRELLARIHAVLRRSARECPCDTLEFDGLSIDLTCRDVRLDGELIELTSLEFDLLAFMAQSPRQVFSREALLDQVWGSSAEWQTVNTVSEHIHRLRRRIERDPAHPEWIETIRGAGYRFIP